MPVAPAPLGARLLSRSLSSLTAAKPRLTIPSAREIPQRRNSPRRGPNGDNAPSNRQPRAEQTTTRRPTDTNMRSDGHGDQRNRGMRMFVPSPAKKVVVNGKLITTPDVWAFLQETRIQYDNSKTRPLILNDVDKHIHKTFACKIGITNQHILHPYHLIYLQPRGHPLIEGIKSRYREKLKTQPLWVYFLPMDDHPGLVRSLGQRRLAREFWAALEAQVGTDPGPRGTVVVTIYDSRKAASAPAAQFGKALADAVMADHRRRKARS